MSFVGVGILIVVSTIDIGEMGYRVVTCSMGSDEIWVSMMWFAMKACIEETCWMGGDEIQETTICFGTGAENFAISGAFFIVISFASSDSQKKGEFGFCLQKRRCQ